MAPGVGPPSTIPPPHPHCAVRCPSLAHQITDVAGGGSILKMMTDDGEFGTVYPKIRLALKMEACGYRSVRPGCEYGGTKARGAAWNRQQAAVSVRCVPDDALALSPAGFSLSPPWLGDGSASGHGPRLVHYRHKEEGDAAAADRSRGDRSWDGEAVSTLAARPSLRMCSA